MISAESSIVLPINWLMSTDASDLNVFKISQFASSSTSTQPLSISHCLTIHDNLTWTLYVHGTKIDISSSPALGSDIPVLLQPRAINSFLEKLDTLHICTGNLESHFVQLCDSHQGKILSPDGSVAAYKDSYCPVLYEGVSYESTVRSAKCSLVVNVGSKCDSCRKYRSVLRAMYSRQKRHSPTSEKTDISSHANYRYLSTPEKNERMANLRAEVTQQKREIDRLREKVNKLTETSGVEVDKQMHGDLSSIMEEMTEDVRKKFPENSFERVFGTSNYRQKRMKDRRI